MKPALSLRDRIRQALQSAGPRGIVGRYALLRDVFPSGYSLEQSGWFNEDLNVLIERGLVVETREQAAGTGHEGPPVFEWRYTWFA